jgi:HD domain
VSAEKNDRETMSRGPVSKQVLWSAFELALLLAAVAASIVWGRSSEWHPLSLVIFLLAIAFFGERFSVETSTGELSASLGAMVLAMGLLGPVPAAACGVAAMLLRSAAKRLSPALWVNNLAIYAAAPLLGGLVLVAAGPHFIGVHSESPSRSAGIGILLLVATAVLLIVNFVLFALNLRVTEGQRLIPLTREVFLPLLPGELAVGVIATLLVFAYRGAGLLAVTAAIPVLLIFRHLTVALLRSEDRAEQLLARSRQLVGLQLGVLRTLVRALEKRAETTGHHAAAVAGYAKALAGEAGCTEVEQDTIHAAGLLHEIGKFTWPDHILHGEVGAEPDIEMVRNHPQEGALLVGSLDGYGEVAEAILYHHERVDGRGYPAGLIGGEIPIGSRILAICSAYDAMTAPHGYRQTMAPAEAMAELRNGARDGQLDGDLVELFIALLEQQGETFAQALDFETELEFERRVSELASPRAPNPTPQVEILPRLRRR